MGNNYIDIGKVLKASRVEQNKELKDISKDSKVSEEYLEAIEAGRIEEFPSIVYYNLFARSYAKELGLDTDAIFEELEADIRESDRTEGNLPDSETNTYRPRDIKTGGSTIKNIIWIVAFVVVISLVVIFVLKNNEDTSQINEDDVISNTQVEETMTSDLKVVEDSLLAVSDSSQIIIEEEPELPEMRLRIDATELSWTLVLADGDTVLNRNLDTGHYRNLTAHEQFLITSGNPNALIIELNDTLLRPLSPTGRPVRNIEITHLNKNQYYQVEEETKSEEPGIGEF